MAKRLAFLTLAASLAFSHPMGNFSVNHYARFDAKPSGVEVTYALDLAELPTFDLLRQWGLDRNSPQAALHQKAAEQARAWARNLSFTSNGQTVAARFVRSEFVIADGAGDLPVVRITSHLHLEPPSGQLNYEDRNYPDRAGWKEIVTRASEDRSKALSEYPQDPTVAPPQDMRASLEVSGVVARKKPLPPAPAPAPILATPAPKQSPAAPQPAGTVVKGDYLSRLLHQRELTFSMILIALGVAFALGAAHALTPGHGKTIVAAYLVGSRGTLKHAAYLGAMVTFTHTVSVFALGLATLFLFQYVMPEKITQVLGVVSGLSIVAIGAFMLYKRWRAVAHSHAHEQHGYSHVHTHAHTHAHQHEHADHSHAHAHAAAAHSHAHTHAEHSHTHHHDHAHSHPHTHDGVHFHTHDHPHSHGALVHSHGPGGHVHSHDVPDEISWASLSALAISGGLVPCESALVLLLSAIALGRVGLGLLLLIAFSLGLAVVLMGIGMIVIYAKNLLPARTKQERSPIFRWVPIASAAVVMIIGVLMTGVSLGWIQTGWVV
ncbi:MAG: hypothetical protein JO022_20000 [Acidobacteriaceae bacterium]|nr:hypothetical protein [Acidobacteriaceae bacterium]